MRFEYIMEKEIIETYHFHPSDYDINGRRKMDGAPNLLDPTIFNPKKAKINKCISNLEGKLSSPDEYMIQRTNDGLYKINVDNSIIYCFDNNPTPWMQSERWRNIVSM